MTTTKVLLLALGSLVFYGSAYAQRSYYPPQMTPGGQMVPGLSTYGNMPSGNGGFWGAQQGVGNVVRDGNDALYDAQGNRYNGRNNVPQWVTPQGYIVSYPCQYCQRIR